MFHAHGMHHRGLVGLRYWILFLLRRKEMTGAEIMNTLEEMSMGMWRPSPGSVYPMLKDLETEGLIVSKIVENKKYYSITEKGKNVLEYIMIPDMEKYSQKFGIDEVLETLDGYAEYLLENRETLKNNENLKNRLKEIVQKFNEALKE